MGGPAWSTALAARDAATDIFYGLAALGAVVLLSGIGLYWAKRFRRRYDRPAAQDGGLPVDRLDEMYRSGLISREEFDVLRRRAMGLAAGPGRKGDSGLSPGGGVDDETRRQEDTASPDQQEQE